MRPLLIIFNYFEMEILFGILFLILFIFLEISIYKKVGKFYALAMMFSLFSISYHTLWLSVALVPTIVIMMIASIIVIEKYDEIKDYNMFFFIIGSLTCFLGWMNFQFVTLAIPLMFYYLKKKDNNYTLKEFFRLCFMWGIGFGITWFSKWIITDLLYNTGSIKDALNQIFYRAGTDLYQYGKINAISTVLINLLYIIIQLIVQYIILYLDLIFNKRSRNKNLNKKEIIIYILTALIPFATCVLFKNHSYLHARNFVYRNFIILIFNIFIIYYKIYVDKKENCSN